MKVGIDSYCYHRYFGEVYGNQEEPGRRMTYEDFLRRAAELKVDGVSLETCFFESLEDAYLKGLRRSLTRARWSRRRLGPPQGLRGRQEAGGHGET